MNQLRALLASVSEQKEAVERIQCMLDLLNAIEEIIPATPGSRAHIEHQLHRLMADMIASKSGLATTPSTEGVLKQLYH